MRSNRRVFGIVIAIAIVVALVVWLRAERPIRVDVTADRTSLAPGESVALVAKIADTGGKEVASTCIVTWSANDGTITGSGARVTWEAPIAHVTARVTARAKCGSSNAEGGIDLAVASPKKDAPVARPNEKPEPSAPIGSTAPSDSPAPIIDEIRLEKTEVCRGETNLVTVRAHDPAGVDDAWLAIYIDGQPGASVPVPYVKAGLPLAKKVIVHGKDNRTQTIADIPQVVVKDCDVPRVVLVSWSMVPNAQDTFRFVARVLPKGSQAPFTPESWEWDFGDGGGVVTEEPNAEHGYLDRPQRSLASSFLVKVKIKSHEGETADGRVAVTLRNTFFVERAMHKVSLLQIVMDPRYPERGKDDIVRQRALVRTPEPDPVTITKVTLVETIGGEDRPEKTIAPKDLLGTTRIGSSWTTVPLSMDLNGNAQLFMQRYTIEGEAADGTRVYGTISLMAPPRLDKDHNTPISDELQKARIMAAMQILKKPTVTSEDLMRLDEQGRLPRALPSSSAAASAAPSAARSAAPPVASGAVHHDPKAKVQ